MAETTATEPTGSETPRDLDSLLTLAAGVSGQATRQERSEPIAQPAEAIPEPVAEAIYEPVAEEAEATDIQVALGGVIDAIARMDTAKATVASVAKELSDLRTALDAYSADDFLDSTVAGVRVPLTPKTALLAKRAELHRACDEVRQSYENLMEHQSNLTDSAYLPEPERPMILERSAVPHRLALEEREETMNAHFGPSDDMLSADMAEVLRSDRPRQSAPPSRMPERPYQPPRRLARVEEPEETEVPGFLQRLGLRGSRQVETN